MRNCWLQGIEAVIQWQQRVAPEGDDDGFFLHRQHGGLCIFWTSGQVGGGGSLLPLGDGLLVDPVALRQNP